MASQTHGNRLVCFDLGRVLVRICDNWQHAADIAGVSVRISELSMDAKSQLHHVVCQSEIGAIDQRQFAIAVAPLLHLKFDDLMKMSDAFLIGPFDGTAQLIDDLSARAVPTACLSNTNDSHWQIMSDPARSNGLRLDRLNYRFASHLLKLRKPDPVIFEHVEKQTGKRGRDIMFFDDIEENVAAARNAGWKAHQVMPGEDPIPRIREVLHVEGILPA